MKKTLTLISQLTVFLGLPASFVAAACQTPAPLVHGRFDHWLFNSPLNDATLLLPGLFISAVMSVALIVVHHLRSDEALERITRLPRSGGSVKTVAKARKQLKAAASNPASTLA